MHKNNCPVKNVKCLSIIFTSEAMIFNIVLPSTRARMKTSNFMERTVKRMSDLKKKSTGKRILSWFLSLTMTVTLPQILPELQPVVNAAENEQVSGATATATVSDRVQVSVDSQVVELVLYDKGIYEGSVTLPAGSYNGILLINGTANGTETSLILEEDTMVFFRLKDGALYNSVTDSLVHTAALVGNFAGIQFEDESGSQYNLGTWNPEDGNAELSYLGGGLYSRTFYFQPLETELSLAEGYKVAFDDSWDYSLGNGGANIDVTLPAETDSMTVFVDEINQQVWDDIRTPHFESVHNNGNISRAPFTTVISLIGTVRSGDSDWDTRLTGYEFRPVSDTLYVYSQVLQGGTYRQYVMTSTL